MGYDSKDTSSDFYSTFDSGGGPTIPSKCKEDFAHMDSGSGMKKVPDSGATHGAVPEVPSKKE